MVGGLIATVALPAYGAWRPTEDAVTLQQVAADDAQSLLVSSDSTSADLARDSYSATTPEEIAKKKAEEAAAAAAAAAA
ncbi:MAG TPA: M23 family peptidase, partial [Microbacterium sp.]|nr:M23 family peptidase [Microbacterium sp.]